MMQLERIAHMERILDEASAALRVAEEDPSRLPALQPAIEELEAYYTGPLWKQDYDDDCAGKLPSHFKRGVLSEDAVYELLQAWDAYRQSGHSPE